MGKKLIWVILFLVIIAVLVYYLLFYHIKESATPTKQNSSTSKSNAYVYDNKLHYGFDYPTGWTVSTNINKDVGPCDPNKYYEGYTCVDFPDSNIKKVITFTKEISQNGSIISLNIEFTVKSGNLQEVTNEFENEVKTSGLPILSEKPISVNGVNGKDILTGTPDWKLRGVIFSANNMTYIFKYSSQAEFYSRYGGIFNNTVNSFDIK